MKRILSLAILATAMLASSCALKDDFKGTDSDFATVSVTVGEPGTVMALLLMNFIMQSTMTKPTSLENLEEPFKM